MCARLEHPPVLPMPEHDAWTRKLTEIASAPLEFCPDFPAIAKRYEAWWHQEIIDRPLFMASRIIDRSRPFSKHFDLLLEDADRWFAETRADMRNIRAIGDYLPNVRVDFGPVFMGEMFGARTEFGSGTTWTHAFIDDDWLVPSGAEGSGAPDWTIDEDSRFWKQFVKLSGMVAADAAGRYLVRTPDYGGSGDVLLNLRGPEKLCIDVIERPDVVSEAANGIYPSWHRAVTENYRRVLSHGAGIIHWIGLWSNAPYVIPACDFNYLIGPEQFNRVFLPDIARRAATVGRAVFHLDGTGATKHIDALLEIPEIRAIQYVTGAGTPSALPWIDMFRKIQTKGRSLVITCLAHEVMPLLDELKPEGLCFVPARGSGDPAIEDVFEALCKRFS